MERVVLLVLLLLMLCVGMLAGCGKNSATDSRTNADVNGFSGSLDEIKKPSSNTIFEGNSPKAGAKDEEGAQDTVNAWRSELSSGETVTGATELGSETNNSAEEEMMTMKVVIGQKEYTVTLDKGKAAQELKTMLPFTLTMQELNGNEKYGDISQSLTQDVYSPGEIHAGDILLWGSDTLVIFYKDFPTQYSYTKIGRIDDPEGLKDAVGKRSVEVVFQ